jgi:hypothetical protein
VGNWNASCVQAIRFFDRFFVTTSNVGGKKNFLLRNSFFACDDRVPGKQQQDSATRSGEISPFWEKI